MKISDTFILCFIVNKTEYKTWYFIQIVSTGDNLNEISPYSVKI